MPEPSVPLPSAQPDVRAGRLAPEAYALNFADAAPRYSATQALVEAERCLYCHDAPCATACPTGIDVPSFIRRIAEGNVKGAARAILEANPLGGLCARVCPTEELCEQVCVKVAQQGKPVEIGRLQRYAVDAVMARPQRELFTRAPATGKRIAIVGAGPAGLACAHTLARLGHDVTVHDARAKPGGLNEYGLASYKTAGGFAQREIAWLMEIGGITLRHGWRLENADQLALLRNSFDAVFLGIGLGGTNALKIPGEDLAGVRDAVDFIAELLQVADKATVPVGRRVVVIGGGMTAVDAAVQSKLLGAEEVHMVYRRGPEQMGASHAERDWAQTHGVTVHFHLSPQALVGANGQVTAARFTAADGSLREFAADQVLKAIGQKLVPAPLEGSGLVVEGGRVEADDDGRTGVAGLYVGGDARAGGRDLTVEAVEDGKRAARAIHAQLSA